MLCAHARPDPPESFVKFKMSEKSLFAVLLRSPWWISFLLVAVIALVAGALLPAEYAGVGMLGAFLSLSSAAWPCGVSETCPALRWLRKFCKACPA
jgi:hypothetical protein